MGYKESKYKILSHSEKFCNFNKITKFLLKLYCSILLHPGFSIIELKVYEIFDFKVLNDLILFIITEAI